MMKICIKCGRELELNSNNFFKRKDSKDGFRNECKSCKKEIRTSYYEENKEKILTQAKGYQEKNKEKIKVRSKEYREENKEKIKQKHLDNKEYNNKASREYYYRNREDRLEKAKLWKKENKEKNDIIKKRWYKTPRGKEYSRLRLRKRRELSKGSDFTLNEWEMCLKHFGKSCAYCGERLRKLEMDHFIPLTKGGLLTKSNVVPACRSCNATKNAQDFFEWYPKQNYYSIERENKILDYLGREAKHVSLQIYRQGN